VTPLGSHLLTITASAGTLTSSLPLTLVVN
jgi:hypothetical protein